MKVTVRIHRSTGLEFKRKKLQDDNTVILRKDSRKRYEWRPLVKTVEAKHGWFGRARFFADIYPEATETWTYDYDLKTEDKPKWNKAVSKQFLAKKILDKAGEDVKDKGSGMGIAIIGLLIVVMGVIQILIATGRLKI